jgi:hypothetical protein
LKYFLTYDRDLVLKYLRFVFEKGALFLPINTSPQTFSLLMLISRIFVP